MNDGLIPRRYAKALYKVAIERDVKPQIYDLMLSLVASFADAPQLSAVINNPYQSAADKLALLHTAAGITAADSDDVATQLYDDFLQLLINNNRLGMAHAIALAFVELYRKENNIMVVRLVTAAPLDEANQARLKNFIGKHLNGASMEYTATVDPSLTGGFLVTIDNERLDASISNELKQLRLKLLSKHS